MKNILRMSLKNKTKDELKDKEKKYSENYNQLIGCLNLFKEIKSNRKLRAKEKIEKLIFDYFKRDCTLFIENLFSKYAELYNFIKNNKEFKYLEEFKYNKELEIEKENTFNNILKMVTYFDIDLNKPSLILKSELRALLYDFTENINNFIETDQRKNLLFLFLRKYMAIYLS